MKVKELIAELNEYPMDAIVHICDTHEEDEELTNFYIETVQDNLDAERPNVALCYNSISQIYKK